MKVLIKTSLCFVISGLLAWIAFLKNSASFNSFAGDTIIQMIGTIFAINIGIVPILFYEINKIEKEIGEPGDFSSVKLVNTTKCSSYDCSCHYFISYWWFKENGSSVDRIWA